jgi:hypothetical protein
MSFDTGGVAVTKKTGCIFQWFDLNVTKAIRYKHRNSWRKPKCSECAVSPGRGYTECAVSLDGGYTVRSIAWRRVHSAQYHLTEDTQCAVSSGGGYTVRSITWRRTHSAQYHLTEDTQCAVSLDGGYFLANKGNYNLKRLITPKGLCKLKVPFAGEVNQVGLRLRSVLLWRIENGLCAT